nr:hypothetical protein [Pedobacter panaciterrae]
MFRKIHSNRDPQDTILKALRKEFGAYIDYLKNRVIHVLRTYPKMAFFLMVLLMSASILLTLTVCKPVKKVNEISVGHAVKPAQDGIGQIMSKAAAINESLHLKQEITALIAKDSLSASDSIRLEVAIDRLHQLTLKTNPNEPH